jgi:CRP-like cAMP-binding protein
LQAPAASTRVLATRPAELSAGTIVGEQVLFAEDPGELDVRALEDSLVLELSWPRQKELSAAYPELGFEVLRAAGAVIAARHRTLLGCGDQ